MTKAPSRLSNHTNEFHLTWFDGGGTTGWADFVVDFKAFSRPENKVLANVKHWDCGEFRGPEHSIFGAAVGHVRRKVRIDQGGAGISYLQYEVGGEDFDLVQTVGDKENVLSPVRFNAVIAWECQKIGITYRYQARQLRTNTTRERLNAFMKPLWGKTPLHSANWTTSGKGKDAFAAMQHAIYRLRKLKQESISKPWKLMDGSRFNAYWDCSCSRKDGSRWKITCDLVHPS